MNSQALKLKLFMDCFGADRDYFKRNRGRPGFFPRQLKDMHNVGFKQSIRLSYTFNRWLDIIPTLNINSRIQEALTTCTWQFGHKAKPVTFACRSVLCPWCRSSKLMKAISLYKKIQYNAQGVVWREDLDCDKSKIFRRPQRRNCLLCLRHVSIEAVGNSVRPVYRAAFYTEEPADESTEELGLMYLNWCLKYNLDTVLTNAELYRQCNHRVKMITEPVNR